MIVNSATDRALETIAARASDALNAYTPGAVPHFDDTRTARAAARDYFDPLSVSAPGNDYFVTRDERGRTTYTRNGSFTLKDGVICAGDGRPARGFNTNGSSGELRVDALDDALGRVANLRIETSGAVAYDRASVDPRTGLRESQRVVIGTLALARFPAATRLIPDGDAGSIRTAENITPHIGRAKDGNFDALEPLRREASRIDVDKSLNALHDAYVAFDALLAAHKAQGQAGKVAMELLK